MNNYDKNIDLSGMDFPQRLRALRKSRHMNRRDLANLSGLCEKTIYNIEKGNQKNTLQKTRMLLAQALDLSLDKLMGTGTITVQPSSPTSSRQSPPWVGIGAATILVIALSLGILWHQSCANAEWTLENGILVVNNKLLGNSLWEISGNGNQIGSCMVSPWNSHNLLVGTTRHSPKGGRLLCLNRANGDTIWEMGPDIPAIVRAFGPEDVMSARFNCNQTMIADLDGDAVPEVIAPFSNSKYYPYAICIVRSDGTLRAQYAHKGHIPTTVVVDIDGDGKDELLCVGTNNNKAYMGATLFILDDKHCNGASIDALCNPWSSEPDSALVRVILPNYPAPFMQKIGGLRLCAFHPQVFNNKEGKVMLSVVVCGDNKPDRITVFLDSELRPVSAQPDDSFLVSIHQWPDSLTTNTGPGDPAWLDDWLSEYIRFEVGRLSLN